jgi:hypothetical protein
VLRDGEQIANTTDTSLVDTGAEEGVEHCYQVVAGNQLGESAPSTETCLTPTLASLPSLSFLEAEDRQRGDEIGLLWSLDGDASEIDHYRVERAGPDGTEVIATPSPDAESFVDDELEQGAEYTYTVRTVSADDTSAPSSASAVPTTGTASWSQPQADGEATGFAGVGGDIQVPEIAATADAEGSISASPVVGDITGDGDREIVVVTETTADQDSQGLRVVAYSFDDGQLTEEWRTSKVCRSTRRRATASSRSRTSTATASTRSPPSSTTKAPATLAASTAARCTPSTATAASSAPRRSAAATTARSASPSSPTTAASTC